MVVHILPFIPPALYIHLLGPRLAFFIVLALSLTSLGTSGRSLHLPGPQIPHLEKEGVELE